MNAIHWVVGIGICVIRSSALRNVWRKSRTLSLRLVNVIVVVSMLASSLPGITVQMAAAAATADASEQAEETSTVNATPADTATTASVPHNAPTATPMPTVAAPTPMPPVMVPAPVIVDASSALTLTFGTGSNLVLTATPEAILPGEVFTLTWEAQTAAGDPTNLELELTFPIGIDPLETDGFDFQARSLRLELTEQGALLIQIAKDAISPFSLDVALWGSSELANGALAIAQDGLASLTTVGGEVSGLHDTVTVHFPQSAYRSAENGQAEGMDVRIRPLEAAYAEAKSLGGYEEPLPPYTLSGNAFEISAWGKDGKESVHHFDEPITIEVSYDENQIDGDESTLTLFYYDTDSGVWTALPSTVDKVNNKVIALSDHLSSMDLNAQDWEAARLPAMDNFQVSSFTGASSYAFPIQVPPGPGGLQPSLSLSYSSQGVDGASSKTQASWVGMGWSLDVGYIQRNQNGSPDYYGADDIEQYGKDSDYKSDSDPSFNGKDGDDTFSLVVNGQSWSLLRIEDTDNDPNTIDYRTAEESFWKVRRYHLDHGNVGYPIDQSYWVAWDKNGTEYYFGVKEGTNEQLNAIDTESIAYYPTYPDPEPNKCNSVFMQSWQWGLTRTRNIYGKTLEYTYQKQIGIREGECPGYQATTTLAMHPKEIIYPNGRYRVEFVESPVYTSFNHPENVTNNFSDYDARHDYEGDWLTEGDMSGWFAHSSMRFFERSLLQEIKIWHDPDGSANSNSQVIRSYKLNYDFGVIFPNVSWPHDLNHDGTPEPDAGKTPSLSSIEEYDLGGYDVDKDPLPATVFTYGDGMHLTHATNGYGGFVDFGYEQWSQNYDETDLMYKKIATQKCEPPQWTEAGYGLTRYFTDIPGYYCTNLSSYTDNYQPGTRYKLRTHVDNPTDGNGANRFKVGFAWGGDIIWGPDTEIVGGSQYNDFYLTLPAYASQARPVYQCWKSTDTDPNHEYSCRLNELHVTPLLTRYRVTSKTISNAAGGVPAIVTYRYDEPATNDTVHSDWASVWVETGMYERASSVPYTEYRGHAMVQEIGPVVANRLLGDQQLVNTTFFYQSDYLKGKAAASLSHTQDVVDGFTSLDQSRWNWDGDVQTSLPWVNNDPALQITSAATDWSADPYFGRTQDSLGDGDMVMVQFRLEGDDTQARFGLEDTSANQRWGIKIEGSTISTNYRLNGVEQLPDTLLTSFQRGRWYVLLIGSDSEGYFARVWERDHPENSGRKEIATAVPSGKNYHFKSWVLNGTAYLDEYIEGKVYSLNETLYESLDHSDINDIPAPGPLPLGRYQDNAGVWQYTDPFVDLNIVWTRAIQTKSMSFNGSAHLIGTLTSYRYDEDDQGGTQYGNQTVVIQSAWNGTTFADERISRTGYYPRDDASGYLVGFPAFQKSYHCPSGTNGSCYDSVLKPLFDGASPWGFEHLLSSVQYIYDNNTTFAASPTLGELKIQRSLIDALPGNINTQRFQDTRFDYDAWGNPEKVTTYTEAGTGSDIASEVAQTTRTCYGDFNWFTGVCTPDEYHAYATGMTNNLGHKTQIAYDKTLGVPISETNPNGQVTQAYYDTFGRIKGICRPLDLGCTPDEPSVALEYKLEEDDSGVIRFSTVATQTLNAKDEVVVIRKFYNGLGQLLQTQQVNVTVNGQPGQDVIVDYYYDILGRLVKQSVPYPVATGTGYRAPNPLMTYHAETIFDVLGRPVWGYAYDGTPQHTEYGLQSVTAYDPRSIGSNNVFSTTTTSDVWGRTVSVEPPDGPTLEYFYDTFGRLDHIEQIAAGSHETLTTTLKYDYAGRKTWMDDPDMGEWWYAYDALGNLKYQDDANEQRTCMYYDGLNRLTGKAYTMTGSSCPATATTQYFYDDYAAFEDDYPDVSFDFLQESSIGSRTWLKDASGYSIWNYDEFGRTTTATRGFNDPDLGGFYTFTNTYNLVNQPVTTQYPDGEVITTTYRNGAPVSLGTNAGDVSYYAHDVIYDEVGRMTSVTGGNGLESLYSYYAWDEVVNDVGQGGRLKQLTTGGNLLNLRYTYDQAGNISTIADTVVNNDESPIGTQTLTFTYDALNRLFTADADAVGEVPGYDLGYEYDTFGRLVEKDGNTIEYGENGAPPHAASRMKEADETVVGSYQYDANGNMTVRTEDGVRYDQTWTVENKLASVTWLGEDGRYTTYFVYDGDSNRLLMVESYPDGGEITTLYIGGVYEKQINTGSNPVAGMPSQGNVAVAFFKERYRSPELKYGEPFFKVVREYLSEMAQTSPENAWIDRIVARLQAQSYAISPVEAGYQAPNRAHNLSAVFAPDGTLMVAANDGTADWTMNWRLTGFGRLGQIASIGAPENGESVGNRFAYQYRSLGLENWYVNSADGLEQGFTLAEQPAGNGPVLLLADTNLLVQGEQAILLAQGAVQLVYSKLLAWDANGVSLPASLAASENGLQIVVDDSGATYPITIDPLLQSAAWTIQGQSGAKLGYSVASAGDVNGDGYSDVIVGAPYYDYSGLADAGAAFVYLGGAQGLSSTANWSAYGSQASEHFGTSVSAAGDVNGDSFVEIIVGAPDYKISFGGSPVAAGRACVFAGSSSGLGASPAWTANADEAGAQFGYSVGGAGDFNGDGFADVAVGAPLDATGDVGNTIVEGRVFVYHGSAQGLGTTPVNMLVGDQDMARFGHAVAVAGDFNADGYDDLVVGSPLYGMNNSYTQQGAWVTEIDAGLITLYTGSPSGLITSAAWGRTSGQANAQLGYAVAAAGDINADGYADLVAGAPYYDNGQTDEGRAYWYLGNTSFTGAPGDLFVESNQASANMGISVRTAGDVQGDGYADIIVGVSGYDGTYTNGGRSLVYAGGATGLNTTAIWSVNGTQANAAFGTAVSVAGDVNGDGYNDVVVGYPGSLGGASVYYGGADELSQTANWATNGSQVSARHGYAVGMAGDVNGDGYVDLLVGAPYFDVDQKADAGQVSLYCGSASGTPATPSRVWNGDQAQALFGSAVGTAGDVDGDGYADFFAAAYLYDNGQTDEGRVSVYRGSATACDAAYTLLPAWNLEGNQANAYFGYAAGSAGDVNADGFADLIVGAYQYINGISAGAAFVYYGSTNGLSTTANWQITGQQQTEQLGYAVGTAGDVNGDGYSDVIIGAPRYDKTTSPTLVDNGRVLVYTGSQAGLSNTAAWEFNGNKDNDHFGAAVSSAGDVNGDGYADVLIGAENRNTSSGGEGAVYAFHGSASGLGASSAWSVAGNQANAHVGYSVGLAGDLNRDGYSDIAFGAPNYGSSRGRVYVHYGGASGLGASPARTQDGEQLGSQFGFSLGSAGDVDGDGYAELIIGAKEYGSLTHVGRTSLFYGGGGNLGLNPRQRQADGLPLANLGLTARLTQGQFQVETRPYAPFGCGRVRLELEVKAQGTPFDGTSLETNPTWWNTCTQTGSLTLTQGGLGDYVAYHWRVRLAYHPADFPYLAHTPWVTIPLNGWNESDFRSNDASAPESSHSLGNPDGLNGYYINGAEISFSATDIGGIGVATIQYSTGDGCSDNPDFADWQTYAGPFTITNNGTYFLCHRAVDKAQNQESVVLGNNTLTFSVDSTPPTVTVSTQGIVGFNGWYRSDPLVITLSTADNLSGMDELRYRLDDGDWQTASGQSATLSLAGEGEHTLEYQATDLAGNQVTMPGMAFHIDASAALISDISPAPFTLITETRPKVSAVLDLSGADLANVAMYLDGRLVTPNLTATGNQQYRVVYDHTLGLNTDLEEGTHTIFLVVTDDAGNRSEAAWQFSVDSYTWVEVLSPFDGTILNQDAVSLTLATEAGQPVTLTMSLSGTVQTAQVTQSGRLVLALGGLAQGENDVTIEVTDLAGNQASTALTLDYQPAQHSAQLYASQAHFAPSVSRISIQQPQARQLALLASVQPKDKPWHLQDWQISISCQSGSNWLLVKTIQSAVTVVETKNWVAYWDGKKDDGQAVEGECHYRLEASFEHESSGVTETVLSPIGTVWVDRTPPAAPLVDTANHPDHLGSTIWFRHATAVWGSADADSSRVVVYYTLNSFDTPVKVTAEVVNGRWLVNLPLTDGEVATVRVTALDAAGNESEPSEAFQIGLSSDILFTAPAQVSPTVIGGGMDVSLTATLRTGGAPLRWLRVFTPVGASPVLSEAGTSPDGRLFTGTWQTPLSGNYEGPALLLFQAEDTATPPVNDETIAAPYLDLRPPWLAIHAPAEGQFTGGRELTVSGAAEPYSAVSVFAIMGDVNPLENNQQPIITATTQADADGFWQAKLTFEVSSRYTLQAQARDAVGNIGPAAVVHVRVDLQAPSVTAFDATEPFLNPLITNTTILHATIVDDLTGVSWAEGTVYDLPGAPGDWTNAFVRFANDPNQFFMALLGIPIETGEGQKYVDITAVDWVGNVMNTTVPAFVVDKTQPRLLSVDLSGTGSNLYLPNAQAIYYGPLSTGTLFVQAEADDSNGNLAVAGIQSILFPNLFTTNDGGSMPGNGSVQLALTREYGLTGSNAGAYRIISVTDRAENTAQTPITVTHFTVTYDAVSPQFEAVSLQAQPDGRHLYISGQTLYYGPLSTGGFAVNATATDASSGVRDVTFPALFGAGALAVSKQPGSDSFGRTYTINGDEEGTFNLIATDNVGNPQTNGSIVIHKDSTLPTLSLDITHRIDTFTLAWDAQDTGSGVDLNTLAVSHCDADGENCTPIAITPAAQGSVTFTGSDLVYTFRVTVADRVGNITTQTSQPYSTASVTKYYLLGGRIAMRKSNGAASAVYYLYGDHLGSTNLITDASGDMASQARNLPFGETRWGGTQLTDFSFTGQRQDGFGLMDFNARYYSSRLGRFVSADTIVPRQNQVVLAWDRYAGLNNNPIRFIDPSGHGAYCGDDYDPGCLNEEELYYYNLATNQPLVFEDLPVSETDLDWIQWFGGTEYAYDDHKAYLKGESNYNYDAYCQGFHCGIDLGAPLDTSIKAGVYGKVLRTWDDGVNGGWKMEVKYGDYIIRYEHLHKKPMVADGDFVTPDTTIGLVGNPAGTDSPINTHLHLEVRYSSSGNADYKDRIENPLLHMTSSQYQALQVVAVDQEDVKNVTFHWEIKDPLLQPSPIHRGGGVLWPPEP